MLNDYKLFDRYRYMHRARRAAPLSNDGEHRVREQWLVDKSWPKDSITIHVNCNDIFAWGCADSEDLLHEEIKALFDHVVKDPDHGAAVFCIKKRKAKPQAPVYEILKKQNVWPIDEIIKDFT